MIIIPTKERPQNIRRFIDAYNETEASEPVTLLINNDDKYLADYYNLDCSFSVFLTKERTLPDIFNDFYSKHSNLEYYGIICDDVIPQTKNWDKILKESCLKHNIAWGNDLKEGAILATHPFLSGKFVRAVGHLACPNFQHGYVDLLWTVAAYMLNGKYHNDIILEHKQDNPKQYDKLKDHLYYQEVLPKYVELIKHLIISGDLCK